MSDTQSDDSLSSVYTQVTHEEHITLAPDTYVGSIEKQVSNLYVYGEENKTSQKHTLQNHPNDQIILCLHLRKISLGKSKM